MTTADPKAAVKRARAKRNAQRKHDAKVFGIGMLVGPLVLAMLIVFFAPRSPTLTTPSGEPVTATVVSKAYTGSYDLDHEDTSDYVLAEDGTWVPRGYYSQRSGPTQKICDYLHKQLVPDPIYGTRCI